MSGRRESPLRLRRLEAPGAVLLIAADYEGEIEPLGLAEAGGLERLLALGANPVPGGRARGWRIELPESRRSIHFRELAHGGLLGGLTGRRFLRLDRGIQALESAASLAHLGVGVPGPVFLRATRHGPFWHMELAHEFIEESVPGGFFLESSPDQIATLSTVREAGRIVRAFHDAGASHPDLHVDNLLVRAGVPATVLVTDLDGVRIATPPDPTRRMRELMRLYRSLSKRRLPDDRRKRCASAFFAGYVSGDRELRAALLRRAKAEARRVALHELFYQPAPPAPGAPRDAQRRARLASLS